MKQVDVAIIGAGSGGLSAWHEIKKVTPNVVMINDGLHGTTCARVGCMPSKVLIQVANDFHRREVFLSEGIHGGDDLTVSRVEALAFVRKLRDRFVASVMSTIEEIGERNIAGRAEFLEPNLLRVGDQEIAAQKIVLATGSRPIIPDRWRALGARLLTSDSVFEQDDLPDRIAVMGVGIIGLELGQALARLGCSVTAFGRSGRIGGLTDPAVNAVAVKTLGSELDLQFSRDVQIDQPGGDALRVTWDGQALEVDVILCALGRRPNVDGIGLDRLGVESDADGVPLFNRQTMQVGDLPIFIAGDVLNELPLLHEASDEGRIAGYNCVHDEMRSFRRRTPLKVTFCDPNIGTVGAHYTQLDPARTEVGEVSFEGQGRSIVMSKEKGLLRVYGERETGRLLGAEMIAPSGEHLSHLLSWAIQRGLTAVEALQLPFYHPVIEEGLRTALRDLRNRCGPDHSGLEIPFDE
ncbi:MAG: dihydrolipoyl dehydrogenase [Verrucomicrobia bacterium]|nr:dihydrolipoyl dehydrogenase [Verrucomicrobiota bacterium]MDA1085882.1 dihydrolipoyl dehydrogenase [Verrucomicrobiota bacterium]